MKINEKAHLTHTFLKDLSKESLSISNEFSQIIKEISEKPLLQQLKNSEYKLNSLLSSWDSLASTLRHDLETFTSRSLKISKNFQRLRTSSEKKFKIQEFQLKNQEKLMAKAEKSINKSLISIKKVWTSDINSMKKCLKDQKTKKNEIRNKINILNSDSFNGLSSILIEKPRKSFDKELISHESAFSELTDLILSHKKLKNSSVHSEHNSNYSLEFDRCMAEVDLNRGQIDHFGNFSIEKSIGGWKSEYESECESFAAVNPSEIKQAISILKKANLLNSKGGNHLEKLTNLLKSPENTHKIELFLQIFNLQNKPKHNSQKPPLKVPSLKKPKEIDPNSTPKAAYVMSEEFNKTILSSENPLSARQAEENFFLDLNKSSLDLQDVRLEDLLKIPYGLAGPKFETTEAVLPELNPENNDSRASEEPYFQCLSILNHNEAKLPSPIKKNIGNPFDSISTGVSSQSGLRSRTTLKTAGSENSQKVFTPGSKGIEDSFKYL